MSHRFRAAAPALLLLFLLPPACVTAEPGEGPYTHPQDQGPVFHEGRFEVYIQYRPQVQYRDFNGVFDISPGSARIVRDFWKQRFSALTRPDHYGEFFIEFYDYMSSFAQAYPMESREKERMLDSLEKSFQAFCSALKVEERFLAFQKDQQRIYGD